MLFYLNYFQLKLLTNSFTVPKYFPFFLGISLFSVIFCFFGSIWTQNLLALIGILSLGILHGANDLKIIAKKSSFQSKSYHFKFFVLYILVVLLGIVFFLYIPKIALLSFVLISCYHFGEQHWNGRFNDKLNSFLFYFSYGSIVFSLLFTLQYASSSEIIFQISSVRIPYQFFLISLTISFFVFILFILKSKMKLYTFIFEFLLLGVLALLFSKSTLLFGFGLYFVLWHSLPSLNSQLSYIYNNKTKHPFIQYIKSALVYWILALIGLSVFYFYVDVSETQYLSIFFSFLAAITFPHAVVMGLMFQSRESNGD